MTVLHNVHVGFPNRLPVIESDRMPSEIALQWIYFPPFFLTVAVGFVCALVTAKLLDATGLNRLFWHPGLVFVSLWMLATSVVGLFFIWP